MSFQKYLLAASFVAPLLLAAPAAAQALSEQEAARRFAAFDSDGDGRISKTEFELNKVVALFQPRQSSTGRSGAATSSVNRQIAITRTTSRLSPDAFNALDTNSDGVLTGGEIIASEVMHFERIDRDGDGFVDRAEFATLVDSLFR
jgi:Ca2+-binding EF-hand superfamily protein